MMDKWVIKIVVRTASHDLCRRGFNSILDLRKAFPPSAQRVKELVTPLANHFAPGLVMGHPLGKLRV
eukprot:1077501-Amphidinium_carterae.1